MSTSPRAVRCEPQAAERHYSPEEIGKIWRLSPSTVRRLFQEEPGVLKIGKANRRDGKRDYITLRIPDSVFQAFHRRRCGNG